MNSLSTPLPTQRMTAEEFFAWTGRQHDGQRYELHQGTVTIMPPPGQLHGFVCWIVGMILGRYIATRGAGFVCTNDTGLIVNRDPDSVRGADLMYFENSVRFEDLAVGYPTQLPTLVVELRSPSDRDRAILGRVSDYHRAGVPLVWVVDPAERYVTTYRPNEFPRVFEKNNSLEDNNVLPNFACVVSELFQLPSDAPKNP